VVNDRPGSASCTTAPDDYPVIQRSSHFDGAFGVSQQQDPGPLAAVRPQGQALPLASVAPLVRNSMAGEAAIASGAAVGQEMRASNGQQTHRHLSAFPDPYRNHLRLHQLCFVAACLTNAPLIGVAREKACGPDSRSPFYHANLPAAAIDAVRECFSHLKKDLQPCVLQVVVKHHVYIDLLPFPKFRERVLALLSANPQALDEASLCRDLDNDGLVCWGSAAGSGSGAPWDRRSWEVRPWFWRKWRMLTGGVDGEMYGQSQWWREMRGEVADNVQP
jgi:hypothetical protein